MAKKQELKYNLRILEINLIKFSQFELLEKFEKTTTPLIEFQTQFHFKVNKEESKLNCLTTVNMKMIDTNENFADLIVETIFLITPFEIIAKKTGENQYDINDMVLLNIANVSFSTVRGIIFEKLKGTIAQNEIYPLANLAEVFLKKTT